MDFYDYFQTMPWNVRVLLRPSLKKKEKEVYDVENRNEGYQNTMKK